MFLLVFVVLLGTVATVNSDQPEVKMQSTDLGNNTMLTCRAKGFLTSDITLNIKKNHCVLTEEDGVETSGVKPDKNDTYRRKDHVTILKSEVSDYSCEVIGDASTFHVEKVWDPESGGGGRIISSEFIATTPPEIKILSENSEDETYIVLTCLVSGFYPNNIIMNVKKDGRILTREDGVKSSRVCSNEGNTFQRTDSVEIIYSDESNYSCEVIHHASGSGAEMSWTHRRSLPPPPPPSYPESDGGAGAIVATVASVLFLILVLILRFWCLCGHLCRAPRIYAPTRTVVVVVPQGGHDYNRDDENLLGGNLAQVSRNT